MHALLERLKREGSPLMDGNQVTFAWYGKTAPKLYADFNAWEDGHCAVLLSAGKDLWTFTTELPEDAYIEYTFLDEQGKRLKDPWNYKRVSNGMGAYNNYFYMPGAGPAPEIQVQAGIPRGEVIPVLLESENFTATSRRKVHFYRPPVEGPCPLIVVWDGQDYLTRASLPAIVDNLIHTGRMQPVGLAMVEHGDRARMVEYCCNDITLNFLRHRVLPEARNHMDLLDPEEHPGVHGVLGASMGGLMALYTGLRLPHVFGHVLSQSGAFCLDQDDMLVWDLVEQVDPASLRILLSVGRYEYLLETNRRMAARLEELGFDGAYQEYNGGHNYAAWRNELPGALAALYEAG